LISPAAILSLLVLAGPIDLQAQSFTTDDPVIHRMWEVGMENSRTEALAQVLMDSIGPRWAGTPNLTAAQDWLLQVYASWGVPARREQYGTHLGWEQGILHVDLIAPRVQSLEAKMSAQSPGTGGPVEGDVVALPIVAPLNPDVDPSQWLLACEAGAHLPLSQPRNAAFRDALHATSPTKLFGRNVRMTSSLFAIP
jgi:hypothetical protein